METTDDPATGIAALGATYVQWAIDHPRLYEAMFGEALAGMTPSADLHDARLQALSRISEAVRTAVRIRAFRDADEATTVTSLWAQVHGLASLIIADHLPKGADPAAAAHAVIDGWLAETPWPTG